ncbi:MAG: amino acid ABC transporter permease [Bifidobacteriaceae bacterium]|jgi:polar amino acid transport system permease protein|nr:amino acid ABC transporter permease [Bifidobacteriaceae bacterium]
MTVGKLALIYSPWIAASVAALVLAMLPGTFRQPRLRSWVAGAAVVLIAYPLGALRAPTWLVATVYWIPACGTVVSLAMLAWGLAGLARARRQDSHTHDAAGPSPSRLAAPSRAGRASEDSGALAARAEGGNGAGSAASSILASGRASEGSPDLAARTHGGNGAGSAASSILASGRRRGLRPSERASLVRGLQYGALIAVAVVLALVTNWDLMSERLFTLEGLRRAAPRIVPDFFNTLRYTLGAFAVSLSLGTVLALMKLSSARLYRGLATAYIEFFRGMPALIVVFAVAFGIPMALDVTIPTIALKAAIALGCVSAAYMAESIRAGMQAVPKGQIEASRSLGMSHGKTLVSVVIPQAFRIVLPPVTNEIILLTKDTSLVYVMGVMINEYELTKLARDTLSVPEGGLTALFAIGACYLVITLPLGFLVRRMERGFGRSKS